MAVNESTKDIIESFGGVLDIVNLVFESRFKINQFLIEFGWVAAISEAELATVNTAFTLRSVLDQLRDLNAALSQPDVDELAVLQEVVEIIKTLYTAIKEISDNQPTAGLPYPFDQNEFWTQLEDELPEYILHRFIEEEQTMLYGVLHFLGILDEEGMQPAGTDPALHGTDFTGNDRVNYLRRRVRFDRIPTMISDPAGLFEDVYNWGPGQAFNYNRFLNSLKSLMDFVGFSTEFKRPDASLLTEYYDLGSPHVGHIHALELPIVFIPSDFWDTVAQVGLSLMPIPAQGDRGGMPTGFMITPLVEGGLATTVGDPTDGIGLTFSGDFEADGFFRFNVKPTGSDVDIDPAQVTLNGGLVAESTPEEPWELLGSRDSFYILLEGIYLGAYLRGSIADPEFVVELGTSKEEISGAPSLIIGLNFAEGDGFISNIFDRQSQEMKIGGNLSWSSQQGFRVQGQLGFNISLASHISLGPLEFKDMNLGLEVAGQDAALVFGTTVKVELGPFTALIEDIGLKAVLENKEGGGGIFGDLDLEFGFKPPSGVGLSLDAGVVKGGGFLRFYPDQGRYDGILQLSIKEVVNVIAIGLITTQGPNGEEGQFSLLLMITAEFTPIQLGFGFTLNGVGGIIAVHRSMDLEALRIGVRAQTLDNILFPADPIVNATQIISDLETVFPQVQRRYAFGLMGKLGWGTPTLITLELGLILEVPNPVKLAILGVIKMALPTEEAAILKLQVNFLGTIDFEAQYITFDASLFDSKLLAFTLEGDMALRIKWGDNSNFLFSVGGFHPSYTPPPLNLPEMRRLSIGLLTGNPRLTVSTYFAVTSNTVQFGAAIDFFFKVSKFKVIGYLHFDALFQFDPFYFNISLAAGLGVYVGSSEILSIHLSGMLEGPTPWHITGRVKFKIFWVVSISVSVETTWGETKDTSLPDIDVLPKLKEALENKANWLTPLEENGENPDHLVSLRTIENTDDDIIAHPNRSLSVSQKVVPLDMTIEKFGTQNPGDFTHFTLDMLDSDGNLLSEKQLKEEFAPDSFFKLKESERLSRPSFEKYNSGIEGTGSSELTSDYFRERDVMFEQRILDEPDPVSIMVPLAPREFMAFVKGGSAAKTTISARQTRQPVLAPNAVVIADESVSIANVNDMSLFEGNQFPSVMEAEEAINSLIAERPDLDGQLEVVPTFELV